MKLLEGLNEKQKEALLQTEGAVLIIAGAGSGKTKVLTNKIAYLLENNIAKPWNILAITFTNKAANEMKERIKNIIGNAVDDLWMGTFHSICVRILRKHINTLGFDNSFVIYDTSEQKTVIKQCMKDLELDSKEFSDSAIQRYIANSKNKLITVDKALQEAQSKREKVYAEIYSI